MYYSIKQCNQLMNKYISETNTKYDFVIKIRYDAIILNFPDLNKLHKNKLYLIDYSQFHNLLGNNVLIMSVNIANILLNLFNHTEEIYNDGVFFNDEEIFTSFIKKYKIPYQILGKQLFSIDLNRNYFKFA
tara:strand:+ start:3686 stop:4078 length:393 start_codon:yes stop_codon:yes gene_type:complete